MSWSAVQAATDAAAHPSRRSRRPTSPNQSLVPTARRSSSKRPASTTCHFTSARKLGVGTALMNACLDAFAATLGVPPWIAGDWRVTCAEYLPCTIVPTRVVAVKPSVCVPPASGFVTVHVRLGVLGTSSGNTTGYPFHVGVRPNSSDENSQPAGDFADPSTRP